MTEWTACEECARADPPPTSPCPNCVVEEPPRLSEMLDDALYDYQRLAAGAQQVYFFQQPIGSECDGRSRTAEDTNMVYAGALPVGVNFVVGSIEVSFIPVSRASQVTMIPVPDPTEAERKRAYLDMAASGELDVQVVDKHYHSGAPLGRFMRAWETRLVKDGEATLERDAAPWTYGPLVLTLPLSILSGHQFAVQVKWRDGAPRNGRIGVVLHGVRQRPSV